MAIGVVGDRNRYLKISADIVPDRPIPENAKTGRRSHFSLSRVRPKGSRQTTTNSAYRRKWPSSLVDDGPHGLVHSRQNIFVRTLQNFLPFFSADLCSSQNSSV